MKSNSTAILIKIKLRHSLGRPSRSDFVQSGFAGVATNSEFSRVMRVVDEHGTAVILKNNVPRYLVIDFSKAEKEKIAATEDVLAISERLIKQNMEAYYDVLAK